MRIISILNFKGGIGKTTVSINLADVLSREGKRILVIDGERQRNTTSILPDYDVETNYPVTLREVITGKAPLASAIRQARPNFFIVPAHRDLEEAMKHITISGPKTLKQLRTAIQELQGYDFVFIDHSPSYTPLSDALLLASQEILIPVLLEPYSFEGIIDMSNKLGTVLDELEHEVLITGYVPNNLDFTIGMTSRYLNDLKTFFPNKVTSHIRTDAKIKKAQELHKTVWEYDPRSKGSEDFKALADYILTMKEVRV